MEIINLFGASGHAKVIEDIIFSQGNFVGCIFDDNPHCSQIHGIPVYKSSDRLVDGPMIISIGSNQSRRLISERFLVDYAKAISPSSIISPTASIGVGTVIMQGVIVQSDSIIGNHCIINTGASVDHECHIGDYVHISPHATLCGNVHVGEGSWIGAGAILIQGVKIGKWCVIGAGSVVINDIPDNTTAVGTPCKRVLNNYQDKKEI